MEGLLEKIKLHTATGSPSVSELIELQEIARSVKISRAQLEKLIEESVAAQASNVEIYGEPEEESRKPLEEGEYGRPDFDSARNSFDAEMNSRREEEVIPERSEIEFNRPEIVFPEMDDPFARHEPIIEEKSDTDNIIDTLVGNEIESLSKEKIDEVRDLFQKEHTEQVVENEHLREEAQKSSKTEREGDVENFKNLRKDAEDNYNIAREKANNKFEVDRLRFENAEEPQQKNEEYEDAVNDLTKTIHSIQEETEKYEFEASESVSERESIAAWAASSSKRERERVEKMANRNVEAKLSTEQRSFTRDNANYGNKAVTVGTKSAFTLGIVALVGSLLFGFVGGIIGIIGLKKSNEMLKRLKISPNQFESGALSKLKNARTMSIIGIVIGIFKFLRIYLLGYSFYF